MQPLRLCAHIPCVVASFSGTAARSLPFCAAAARRFVSQSQCCWRVGAHSARARRRRRARRSLPPLERIPSPADRRGAVASGPARSCVRCSALLLAQTQRDRGIRLGWLWLPCSGSAPRVVLARAPSETRARELCPAVLGVCVRGVFLHLRLVILRLRCSGAAVVSSPAAQRRARVCVCVYCVHAGAILSARRTAGFRGWCCDVGSVGTYI